jgi:hypothetical protein
MIVTTPFPLDYPVILNGQEYKVLNVRRPKVIDNTSVAKLDSEDAEVTLLANLCDVSPDVIQELDMDDYQGLQKLVMGFSKHNTKKKK